MSTPPDAGPAAVLRKLRQLRKAADVNSATVSRAIGRCDRYVDILEHRVIGSNRDFAVSTLLDYCRAIGVRLCYEPIKGEGRDG